MATIGGPNLGEKYYQYLDRVKQDGGEYKLPNAKEIQPELDNILELNPSLVLIPTAGKSGKLYSVFPSDGSGDFDFSRNGTATYLTKNGLIETAGVDEPRIEVESDGSFKGVLVEPAATNLFNNNSYINISNSSNYRITLTQLIGQGIYGMNSFRGVVPSSYVGGQTQVRFRIKLVAGFYTHRFYLKKGSDFFRVEHLGAILSNSQNENQQVLVVNSITGELANTSENIGIKTKQSIDRGDWWEIYYVIESTGGDAFFDYEPNYSIGSVMEICGSQIELGTAATSYIPTVGSQVTRPADVSARLNSENLIGQTEGAVLLKGAQLARGRLLNLNNNNNSII